MLIPQHNKFVKRIKEMTIYEVNQPIIVELPLKYQSYQKVEKISIMFTIKGELTQVVDKRFDIISDSVFNFNIDNVSITIEKTNNNFTHNIIEESIKRIIHKNIELKKVIRNETSIDNGYFYFNNSNNIQKNIELIINKIISCVLDFEKRGHKPNVDDVINSFYHWLSKRC